jgi:hypothetical protein
MGLQAIVSLVVGLRLLALARGTRRFPELALSMETLLTTAVGYPLLMVAVWLEWMRLPGVAPVFFVAVSIMMVAVSMNYYFTWRVFRPGSVPAVILCLVGTWLLLAPLGGVTTHIAASGIDQGIRNAPVWTTPIVSSVLVAFGWTTGESFLYFRSSRRRLRLGLTEAAVCNRFLLWALAKGAYLGMASLAAFLLILGVNPLGYSSFTVCMAVAGFVYSVCMILCFMPPESYLDWLNRRATALQQA